MFVGDQTDIFYSIYIFSTCSFYYMFKLTSRGGSKCMLLGTALTKITDQSDSFFHSNGRLDWQPVCVVARQLSCPLTIFYNTQIVSLKYPTYKTGLNKWIIIFASMKIVPNPPSVRQHDWDTLQFSELDSTSEHCHLQFWSVHHLGFKLNKKYC